MCFVVIAAAWVTFSWMYPGRSHASVTPHATAGSSSLRSSE
jgi:hypothetical protein